MVKGPNENTLSNTVVYTFAFSVDHTVAATRDKGEWTVIVRIDFATPRSEGDGHGGTPHAQISSCLGQQVTKDNGDTYTNTQNFKTNEDTFLLNDQDIIGAINTGSFTFRVLNWLSDRLLTKEPFKFVNLPNELHFRGSSRAGT